MVIRWIVDKYHVGTSDYIILRDMYRRFKQLPKRKRRSFYKEALKIHHSNQELFKRYRF